MQLFSEQKGGGAESLTFWPGIDLEGLMEAKTCCTLSLHPPDLQEGERAGCEAADARRGGQLMHSRPEVGGGVVHPAARTLSSPRTRG